ncbi:MAG TPA: FkbM family methyltransferase [Burkholderiales bacterium]|nr:FkbM family methyltransferase [Burkholderiales bacterium]
MLAVGRGLALNSLAQSPHLAGTRLTQRFRSEPLGLIDVGSLGGVHPVAEPAAALIQALCFEPDEEAFHALERQYASPAPYAAVKVMRDALGGTRSSSRDLYVAKVPTNTSLLEPNPRFISRYRAERFLVDRVIKVATRPLDEVAPAPFGEIIKLDTQGSEHEILEGAKRLLDERCVAVFCEVEFFQVYRGQKTLSDIDVLLRQHGFALYGVYPHYRSTKSLDPAREHTEERLMWADAVFFRDPFDDLNAGKTLSPRAIDCLILAAWLTGFYDFAIELTQKCVAEGEGRDALIRVAREAAQAAASVLMKDYRGRTPQSYLELRKFVDRHITNSSTDFFSG